MKPLPTDLDLSTRKLILQQRSAVLRELLAVQIKDAAAPALKMAAQAQSGSRWVVRHPWLIAAVVAALVIWRPKGSLNWVTRGWGLWQTWRRLSPVVARWLSRWAVDPAASKVQPESMPTEAPKS